jgi:rubrerythrin
VAEAETIHAHAHLKAMDGVRATAANLEEAMAGEEHEFTHMYPPMVAMAKQEGHKKAERSMTHAMEVEKIHYELFKMALAAVKSGGDLPEGAFHVCPVCGHTELGPAPERCPICNASGAKYLQIG